MQAQKMRRLRRQRLYGQKRGKSLGLRVRLQLQGEKIAPLVTGGSVKASADDAGAFFLPKIRPDIEV